MSVVRLVLNLRELGFNGLGGGVLHGGIKRRINEETAIIDLVRREQQIEIALHRVHGVVFLDKRHPFRV